MLFRPNNILSFFLFDYLIQNIEILKWTKISLDDEDIEESSAYTEDL